MKIKAKHIFLCLGAFIILAIVGANFIKDDTVIITNEELNDSFISGDEIKDYIYVHIDGAINNPRN